MIPGIYQHRICSIFTNMTADYDIVNAADEVMRQAPQLELYVWHRRNGNLNADAEAGVLLGNGASRTPTGRTKNVIFYGKQMYTNRTLILSEYIVQVFFVFRGVCCIPTDTSHEYICLTP